MTDELVCREVHSAGGSLTSYTQVVMLLYSHTYSEIISPALSWSSFQPYTNHVLAVHTPHQSFFFHNHYCPSAFMFTSSSVTASITAAVFSMTSNTDAEECVLCCHAVRISPVPSVLRWLQQWRRESCTTALSRTRVLRPQRPAMFRMQFGRTGNSLGHSLWREVLWSMCVGEWKGVGKSK